MKTIETTPPLAECLSEAYMHAGNDCMNLSIEWIERAQKAASSLAAENKALRDALTELADDADYALKKWLNDGSYSMSTSLAKARSALSQTTIAEDQR